MKGKTALVTTDHRRVWADAIMLRSSAEGRDVVINYHP